MSTNLIDDEPGYDPRIRGTRLKIKFIAEMHNLELSVEKITEPYPLTREQVEAALAYYFEHRDEIDRVLEEDQKSIADLPRIDLGLDDDSPIQ